MTDKQTWNVDGYNQNARFVSDLGGEILNWLAPQPGEEILDLGCGDGALTKSLVKAGAHVIGIDTSPDLLKAAAALGLDVRELSGTELGAKTEFSQKFNAVFSNAVLHWITEPEKLIKGVWTVLKPDGRFVAEFGGHGNVAAIITAMRAVARAHCGDMALAGPWFFPTVGEYTTLLTENGFDVRRAELSPRPTPLPTDMAGWLRTFRKPFFDQFEGEQRQQVLADTLDLLRPSLCDNAGQWTADYIRIRVEAQKS